LPEGEQTLRYQISVDGVRLDSERAKYNGNEIAINSTNDGQLHTVRVVDISSDIVRYEYCYMVLTECCISLDQCLYRAGVDNVNMVFSYRDTVVTAKLPLPYGVDRIQFVAPEFADIQFEVEVPAVNCTFMGENAFNAADYIWYESVDSGETVKITVPQNYSAHLMLGVKEVEQFELGNALRALTLPQDNVDLWISIKAESGKVESYKISTILFTPKFTCPPLKVESDSLMWCVESNFIGNLDCKFKIECLSPEGVSLSFNVGYEDGVLANLDVYGKGMYSYQVFTVKKSMFTAGATVKLFDGSFFVGDPNEFVFFGKEIAIRDAFCWNFDTDALKSVPMKDGCGILCNLIYQGCSAASGENIPTPCYQAIMYFEDRYGNRRPFNSRVSNEYELINPVQVWIINNHLLILHCATDDTVYIDKKYSSIVNKSPDRIMRKMEQRERLETPDYFEYEVREEEINVRSY
jgi:hypothetical protein